MWIASKHLQVSLVTIHTHVHVKMCLFHKLLEKLHKHLVLQSTMIHSESMHTTVHAYIQCMYMYSVYTVHAYRVHMYIAHTYINQTNLPQVLQKGVEGASLLGR